MAKIEEQILVVKLSRLVKEANSNQDQIATQEFITNLEQVAQELLGNGVIVEIETA